ncbi:MAG: hypothetical protein KDB82_00710 [Planctomycetes bacterium]|nr:hypothetical protein [Planctomycetota bacterium]
MTWQLYAVVALVVLALAAVGGVVAVLGLDGHMVAGLAAGIGLALPLMIFGHFNMKRAMRSDSQSAMMGHIYGGFGLRLVLLVVGFFALAFSGLASPAGFAVAFMAGVVLSLGWQMLAFVKETLRRQQESAAAAQ